MIRRSINKALNSRGFRYSENKALSLRIWLQEDAERRRPVTPPQDSYRTPEPVDLGAWIDEQEKNLLHGYGTRNDFIWADRNGQSWHEVAGAKPTKIYRFMRPTWELEGARMRAHCSEACRVERVHNFHGQVVALRVDCPCHEECHCPEVLAEIRGDEVAS